MPTRTQDRHWIAYESLAPKGERVVREKNEEGEVTAFVLKKARLLGLESRNDRVYRLPKAELYEGAKVNIDHPTWMNDTQSQNDKAGFIRNAEAIEGRGIFGDVVLNPKHPRAEQHVWDAENDPNNQGFSHVAITERADVGESHDGVPILNVVEVISVDLVGRPATTNGMFEQENQTVDLKEALERIEALTAEKTKLTADLGVAEQNLNTEKEAHEATKADHEKATKTAEREVLIDNIEGEVVEAMKTAIHAAASVEDAKALIESLTPAANKPQSRSQEEQGKGEDEPQTYEQIAEAGKLAYKGN